MDKNNKKDGSYAKKNLSSVHHASFERLHDVTGNYNQATLLDKLIFWWQISTYTLDDGNIWFTRSVEQIAEESRLSVRTVGRYLKAFADAGYIEKVNRLHKKKNLYIRMTEKLLFLIGDKKGTAPRKAEKATSNDLTRTAPPTPSCVFSEHVGRTGSANLAVSLYKDKDCNTSTNNTVREACSVTFGDNGFEEHNPTPETCVEEPVIETSEATNSSNYPTYAVEQQIGERLSETTKNYIKGTMRNLKTQYQLEFSNPEQVFSEIVFSLLNTEKQFPGIQDMHHRMNLIAKLMREKRWCTPKGFYNHWDVGQVFKAKQEKQAIQASKLKRQESRGDTLYPSAEDKACKYTHITAMNAEAQAYQELQALIATETRYLSMMEAQYKRQPNPMNERVIESTAMKLAKLHDQLGGMELGMQQQAA
ncbi:MAG: helix-turn-helix domain-containing protein [Legionellaceae bacterium]|nr:helix-turn-helix domain-containing protein [Legionellaceae bacterium]